MNTTHEYELDEEISEYELERSKPIPSIEHSYVQVELTLQIGASSRFRPYTELNLDLDGFRSVPDVCVYEKGSLPRQRSATWATIPPLLIIEILSPTQLLGTLFDKAEEYLRRGVDEVWVLVPEIQSITVCRQNQKQHTYTSGKVHHQLTDISINIEKLFAE